MIDVRVTDEAFDSADALRGFEAEMDGVGAVATFLGKVRPEDQTDPVETLTLEHYPGLTERTINEVCRKAMSRWQLGGILVRHRIGRMKPNETIVFVATAAGHRRAAFEACDFLMDFLKTQALFWKKEKRGNTEEWIEPRDQDYCDASRWDVVAGSEKEEGHARN